MLRPKRLRPDNIPEADQPVSGQGRAWQVWLYAFCFAGLAAMVMPDQKPFPYQYVPGQPWSYSSLKAPFDYEVLRQPEEVADSLKILQDEHGPYLLIDPKIEQKQLQQFTDKLAKQVEISRYDTQYDDLLKNPDQYRRFGVALLTDLYQKGITSDNTDYLPNLNRDGTVYLVSGNTTVKTSFSELFTVKKARDFLIDTLPFSPVRQPEVILPMLEDALEPNLVYSDSMTTASLRRKTSALLSTGIIVGKGEEIIAKNELVGPAEVQKLESLSRHFQTQNPWEQYMGYGLMALLVFAGLLASFALLPVLNTPGREQRLALPMIILLCIGLLSFANRFGASVPLLLPIFALPVLLQRIYPAVLCWGAWAAVVLLSGFALDWGGAWMAIQVSGMVGSMLLLVNAQAWATRVASIGSVVFLEVFVWVAAGMAGKLPESVWNYDTVLLFFGAGLLALAVFPLRQMLEKVL